jgi:vacuolar protein sorting-associated protein 35
MESATSIELFVEILDRYVYYFDQRNESVRIPPNPPSRSETNKRQVTTKYLNGLIELIHSNLAGNQQESASVEASKKHFYHTLEMIRSKEYEGIVLTPK